MSDHPTSVELEGLVWHRLRPGHTKAIVSHLVRGCEQCRAVVAPHLAGLLGRSEPPANHLLPDKEAQYEEAIDRAFATAFGGSKVLGEKRKIAAISLISNAPLEELPEVPRHLRGVPLFEALLERSWSLRHEDPEEMVKAAEWARVLAERIDPGSVEVKTLADIQCRSWVELGNAYRVADELTEAETALGRATQLYLRGTQDELLAAHLFDIQASLLGARRRFDLAAIALDLVFAIYQRAGADYLAGRALISKGMCVGYQGKAEQAIELIERGLALVDEDHDPHLIFLARHNQARLLADCGKFREARIALWTLKARGTDSGGRLNELKVRWLEGQINAGLGELDRAESALQEVILEFEEAELPYKAALAGLELGLILFRRGNTDAAIQEVLAAVQVFLSLGIAREVSASLLLLRKAIDRELLNIELLEYVIGQLRRADDGRGTLEPTIDE